jgi:preprotein translocase subunit SecB
MVYGYLRPNVADLVTRAGLPPVYLTDVDFQAFYQARVEAITAAVDESKSATKQ